jgi:hypothetical protein
LNSIQKNSTNYKDGETACPFLGLVDDPTTSFGFPCIGNCCRRAHPVEAVNLEHQSVYCLNAEYDRCPVFTSEGKMPLPADVRLRQGKTRKQKTIVLQIAIGLFVVLIVVLLGKELLWKVLPAPSPVSSGNLQVTTTTMASPSVTVIVTLGSTPVTNITLTITPSRTANVLFSQTASVVSFLAYTPSPTSTPRIQLSLGVALGLEKQFLIHRVLEGESLDLLASKHHTTVAAIQAVNYFLPSPLLANWIVVVPIGITDTQDLPPFETYQVVGENISAGALAQKLSLNVIKFTYYNALSPETVLMQGDWLLIPKTRTSP